MSLLYVPMNEVGRNSAWNGVLVKNHPSSFTLFHHQVHVWEHIQLLYFLFVCLFILVFTNYFCGSSTSTESILRSRAMMISGRLLSKENIYTFTDESSKTSSVSEVTKFFFLKKLQFCFYYPCPNLSRYVKRHEITTIFFSSWILNILRPGCYGLLLLSMI